jgi:hypothetical protein
MGANAACRWIDLTVPAIDGELALNDLEIVGPRDAWLVGTEYPGYPTPSQPVILHWGGTRFKRIEFVRPNTDLTSVAASSSGDVWAVGWNNSRGGNVALHWNGRTWRDTRVPNDRRSKNNMLEDVVSLGSGAAWAVGRVYGEWPIIAHWNGRRWALEAPPTKRQGWLTAIDATSARDVWAAGWIRNPRSHNGLVVAPFAPHWDGKRWSATRLPRSHYISAHLDDIAREGSSVWGVGSTDTAADRGERGRGRAYTVRWSGGQWRLASTLPALGTRGFSGIFAQPSGSLWAWSDKTIARWNGRRWLAGPRVDWPSQQDAKIVGLHGRRGGSLWLLGQYYDGSAQTERFIVRRYDCT